MKLSQKKCVPCEGGVPPFTREQVEPYLAQISSQWQVIDDAQRPGQPKKLKAEFKFKDFAEAMKFVNAVADIAEQEGHHPDMHIHWNRVRVELWTHEIGGLFENDFILASKIEELPG